jgi:hypothetical protein
MIYREAQEIFGPGMLPVSCEESFEIDILLSLL